MYLIDIKGSKADKISGWLRFLFGPVVQTRGSKNKMVFLPTLFGICL